MNLRGVVLFFAFCVPGAGVLAAGRSAREAEATKAHQEFQKDWSDFAANKVERLLADDLVWIGAFGGVRDKTTVLSSIKQRTMTRPQQEEQTRVRVFGDTSIVTMLVTNQDDRDPSLIRKMYMTEVWAKQRNEWKLVSFHSSFAPEPQR
jgi:hypothetical protein